jgi:hypothetical protein
MTTLESLTQWQTMELRHEALIACDYEMAHICTVAIEGDDEARRAVVDAINAAEAMDDDGGYGYGDALGRDDDQPNI